MRWRFTLQSTDFGDQEIYEPIGWADTVLNLKRDPVWHGVFFEYAVDLQFYNAKGKNAYSYLLLAHHALGAAADISLLVEYACSDTADFEEAYSGRLNMGAAEWQAGTTCLFKVPVEQTGCFMKFKSRYDVPVNLDEQLSFDRTTILPLYDRLGPYVNIPSKTIVKTIDLLVDQSNFSGDFAESINIPPDLSTIHSLSYWHIGFTKTNIDDVGVSDITLTRYPSLSDMPPLFVAQENADYHIDAGYGFLAELGVESLAELFGLGCSGPPYGFAEYGIEFRVKVGSDDILLASYVQSGICFPSKTTCDPPDSHSVSDSTVTYSNTFLNVNAGDEVKFYVSVSFGGGYFNGTTGEQGVDFCHKLTLTKDETFFKVTFNSSFTPTPTKAYYLNEALSRAAESISDGCLKVFSEYFSDMFSEPYHRSSGYGCGYAEFITSGKHLRQIQTAEMLVSFKQLFDGINAIHNIGIGPEDDPYQYGTEKILRVEPMEHFYGDTVILSCDKIPEIEFKDETGKLLQKFIFGYEKWEAEEFNGLDEFNTRREYRLTFENTEGVLTQLSNLIASPYAIEVTRRKLPTTKDWRYDNDVFIVVCRDEEPNVVYVANIESPANLIDPSTVYNFGISPVRNAMRWCKVALQSYTDYLTGKLIFTSGDGNYLAKGEYISTACYIDGSVVAENDEISVDLFADPLQAQPILAPIDITFDYPLSLTNFKLLRDSPTQKISIRWGQKVNFVDCYLKELRYRPNQGIATFVLNPAYPFLVESAEYILTESGIPITTEGGTGLIR